MGWYFFLFIMVSQVYMGHQFDWENVKILDEEMNYNKRLISEMIFIKRQKHGLNAQMDTVIRPYIQ